MPTEKKTVKVKALFSTLLIAAIGFVLIGCPGPAAPLTLPCVTFEPPLAVGTQYGTPVGQAPGTVIFTTNQIPVSIQNFVTLGGG